MTYNTKTKNTTSDLIKKIEEVLQEKFPEIEKTFNYQMTFKSGSYDPQGNFAVKLEGLRVGGKSPDAQRYESAMSWDKTLPPLNTELKIGGKSYEIVGINTTGTKVHGKRDGKVYLISTAYVQEAWKYKQAGGA